MTRSGTAPTAREILIEARALIARPEAWTQGTGARDTDGEPIGVEHEDAVSWCATGAINCAVYRHADCLDLPPALQRARDRAGTILTDAATRLTLGHYSETTTYNDQASHGCVLKVFDIAIAAADSPSAGSPPGRPIDTDSAP